MGSLGSGYAAKLINNLIVGGEITLIAEALGLARKAGLDMARLLEALSGGAASSPVLSLKGGRMISGDYTPSSRVLIHLKDQRNAQELARAAGKLILQHTGVLGADAVKLVPAGRNGNAPCKGFLRSREVHKGKLELHGAVKVVQEIAPRLKDGGLVLVLRELVVDVLILDRFGVARVGHTTDAVRPHTLIRDAVLRRFFLLIRSVRSCDGGFDLFSSVERSQFSAGYAAYRPQCLLRSKCLSRRAARQCLRRQ